MMYRKPSAGWDSQSRIRGRFARVGINMLWSSLRRPQDVDRLVILQFVLWLSRPLPRTTARFAT